MEADEDEERLNREDIHFLRKQETIECIDEEIENL